MISLKELQDLLPQCCDVDAYSISRVSVDTKEHILSFMPECKSIIILAHHIQHSIEWSWFNLEASRNGVMAPADLHVQVEMDKLSLLLNNSGYKYALLPYPGSCGIRFKDLADLSGLGKMGDNFLFLHRIWGPWVHLRILLTNVEITDTLPVCDEVCTHCGVCKNVCPADAIQDHELLGNVCSAFQAEEERNYSAYNYKCEICVRACPICDAPKAIQIIH